LKEAEKNEVKILSGPVIYKLIEDYTDWVNEQREKKKKESLSKLTLPVKMRFMHGFVFRHSNPAVVGVKILEGKLRPGIRVLNENGKIVGRVSGIQVQGKNIERAVKGQEVAVSIDKGVVGRNLQENGVLYSYIPNSQFGELTQLKNCFNADEQELIGEIQLLAKKMPKNEEAD
jgi:translation initiation factor 5B